MSKTYSKYDNLPKLQKSILLVMAKKGPQLITELNKTVAKTRVASGEYTSTNRALHALHRKGLVRHVDAKQYRGREFPIYWLTNEGIIQALIHQAKPDLLEQHLENLKLKDENMTLLLDIARVLTPKNKATVLGVLLKTAKGTISLGALLTTILTLTDEKQQQDLFNILKKPKYEQFVRAVSKMLEEWQGRLGAF